MSWWDVSIADPGPGGFVLGGLLIVGGLGALRWLRWSGRRAHAEAVAEVRPVFAPGVVRVPKACPDATAVLPRVREVLRG